MPRKLSQLTNPTPYLYAIHVHIGREINRVSSKPSRIAREVVEEVELPTAPGREKRILYIWYLNPLGRTTLDQVNNQPPPDPDQVVKHLLTPHSLNQSPCQSSLLHLEPR